jgi:CRISPR-associated exonuclease Cas4
MAKFSQRIPISWLQSYAFCEYQIYLEHVREITPEVTPEIIQGLETHAILDEAHKAVAELELTVDDALAKARVEGIAISAREVYVKTGDLVGCIDEVVFLPDTVMIVDDKPGDIAWPGSKLQAWGYCLAFEEQYCPGMPVVAGIRNRDTGSEIWAQPFTQEHRDEVLKAISRIRQLLSGQATATAVRNPRKCRACRFRGECDAAMP